VAITHDAAKRTAVNRSVEFAGPQPVSLKTKRQKELQTLLEAGWYRPVIRGSGRTRRVFYFV